MFGCSEEGCESKHKSPGSSHRMSGSAMTYAAPALRLLGRLEAYTGGRHPYIQQHKVIVWKSIVAQRSAYWQLPQLDSNSIAARALHPFPFSAHTTGKSCFIQEQLYFFLFLWDFMNIPRQWIGLLISPLQLNLRQWHIIQTG